MGGTKTRKPGQKFGVTQKSELKIGKTRNPEKYTLQQRSLAKGVYGKLRPRKRRPKTSKTKTSKAKTSKTKTSKTKTSKTKTSKAKTTKTIPHIHRCTEETVAESKLFNVDMSSGQFIEQKYFSNPFSGDRDDRIFNDRNEDLKNEDPKIV